jgi:hypothetical protein
MRINLSLEDMVVNLVVCWRHLESKLNQELVKKKRLDMIRKKRTAAVEKRMWVRAATVKARQQAAERRALWNARNRDMTMDELLGQRKS